MKRVYRIKSGTRVTYVRSFDDGRSDQRQTTLKRTLEIPEDMLVHQEVGGQACFFRGGNLHLWVKYGDATPVPAKTKKKAKKKSPKKPKKLVHGEIVLDWREQLGLEDLVAALEPFGLTVTEHPACEGSDSYGFIISNRPLTKAELKEAASAM